MVKKNPKRMKEITQKAISFVAPIEDWEELLRQSTKTKLAMAIILREILAAHCSKTREKA